MTAMTRSGPTQEFRRRSYASGISTDMRIFFGSNDSTNIVAAQNLAIGLNSLQHIPSCRGLPFDTPEDMESSFSTRIDYVDQLTTA